MYARKLYLWFLFCIIKYLGFEVIVWFGDKKDQNTIFGEHTKESMKKEKLLSILRTDNIKQNQLTEFALFKR